jgi:glucose-6-phosphate 1-dehydrogenase
MTARPSVQVRVTTAMPALTGVTREAEPCALVIFGAGGDLTRRKLMPALYHMRADGVLPDQMAVIGVAREPLDTATFRAAMLKGCTEFGPGTLDTKTWLSLEQQLFYVQGELNDPGTYARLASMLDGCGLPEGSGHLFYLAIPPQLYPSTIAQLSASGVAPRTSGPTHKPYRRVLIEKPFGTSLESARALNREVQAAFSERQIYRLDHYLGKETVQNLLMFRFANSIFEPVWNRQHVHHVQITAAESVGVEHRGGYYEQAGVVRDMFQNHLLQLLTLAAMEPPVTFSADAVRDEKVKVLRALRSPSPEEMHEYVVRGQYSAGIIDGKAVPGYRQEQGVSPASGTSTYAAVRFMVDNWRWQGVPFYLRSGKRLNRRTTEIAIQFRQPPHLMFPLASGEEIAPNVLAIGIQPEEKIAIRFEVKTPGPGMRPSSVLMDFGYDEAFASQSHDAYETLLLDAMLGDATRFTRSDEVEAAWSAVDPIIEYWAKKTPDHFPNYAAGSWGPKIADEFIARMGARWRE